MLWLTLFGSLDHKLGDLLLYFPFPAFRALYLALLILTYGHYNFKRLLAVQTPVLVSRHGWTSSSFPQAGIIWPGYSVKIIASCKRGCQRTSP